MKRFSLSALLFLLALLTRAAAPQALHVQVSGKAAGRPLLLVPGYVAPGDMWRETAAALGQQYRCHTVTWAGTGGTAPLALPDSVNLFDRYAHALAQYVQQQHLQQPVLVAHQIGGMVALRAAARYPQLFGGLVLLEALPFTMAIQNPRLTPDSLRLPPRAAMLGMMEKMPRATFLSQQRQFISTWVQDTAQQRRVLRWADQADRPTFARLVYESMVTDLRPDLPKLRVPVLLLGIYAAGKIVKPDLTAAEVQPLFERQYATAGAGAEVRLHDTAYEFMMLDAPDWTLRNIRQYLQAHPARR